MSFKMGLNKKEQIQCAKWLEEGVPAEVVAKQLHVSVEIVSRFTREKLDEAERRASARMSKVQKVLKAQKQKAEILKQALQTPITEDPAEESDFT